MKKLLFAFVVALCAISVNAQELKEQEPKLNTRYVFYAEPKSTSLNYVLDSTTGELWCFSYFMDKKHEPQKISGINPSEEDVKYFGRYRLEFIKDGVSIYYYLFDTHTGRIWRGSVSLKNSAVREIDYKVDFVPDTAGEK